MDDSTRRDERSDNHREASRSSRLEHAEQRDEKPEQDDEGRDRPAMTPREREDRWPIG